MPRIKSSEPRNALGRRLGCYLFAAAFAALIAALAYIGLRSESEKGPNSVIPTLGAAAATLGTADQFAR